MAASKAASGYSRYSENGSLDPTFGNGGRVYGPGGALQISIADAIVLQPGGKIVVAGTHEGHFALGRYLSDGTLDSTFGQGSFTPGLTVTRIGPQSSWIHDLVRQRDGKLVAAGESWDGKRYFFVLARYTPKGYLDAKFGKGGVVRTSIGPTSIAYAVSLQRNGKIVAAGSTGEDFEGAGKFALVRYRR